MISWISTPIPSAKLAAAIEQLKATVKRVDTDTMLRRQYRKKRPPTRPRLVCVDGKGGGWVCHPDDRPVHKGKPMVRP